MTKVRLDPEGFFKRIPLLPHQMTDRLTRVGDSIVLCHLGVPQIAEAEWALQIDRHGRMIAEFDLDRLRKMPKIEVFTVHQCAGSPLEPTVATRRVSNLKWGGVRVTDLISREDLRDAAYLWSYGADHGVFSGVECGNYAKDLPVQRLTNDVIVAYELNDQPLPAEQGYPARLVVPGFYGTNSVKWLTRITLADTRVDSPFTTTWYNDPDPAGQGKKPVWALAPESVIVSPAPDDTLEHGETTEIWGWAWSDKPVSDVEISIDGGATWLDANVEKRNARSWQKFSMPWQPALPGGHTLCVRAREDNGPWQPMDGARNSIHRVRVNVR